MTATVSVNHRTQTGSGIRSPYWCDIWGKHLQSWNNGGGDFDDAVGKAKEPGADIYWKQTAMPIGGFALIADLHHAIVGLREFSESCNG